MEETSSRPRGGFRLSELVLKLPLVEVRFVRSDSPAVPSDPAPQARAWVALKASDGSYVTAERDSRGELIARASHIDLWERFGLIHLRDEKIALRAAANDQFVTAEINAGCDLVANRTAILGWESFKVVPQPNGGVALRAFNDKFVSTRRDSSCELRATAAEPLEWEIFQLELVDTK